MLAGSVILFHKAAMFQYRLTFWNIFNLAARREKKPNLAPHSLLI
jgi:hypothetical protein